MTDDLENDLGHLMDEVANLRERVSKIEGWIKHLEDGCADLLKQGESAE